VARTKSKTGKPIPALWRDHPSQWKSSDASAAAKDFFVGPRRTAIRDLTRKLCSPDAFNHRCAAEVARLISRREPGILATCSDLLVDIASTLPKEEWQARGYVLVAAAINATTYTQRQRLLPLVRTHLDENRIAVRAMALEAFAFLATRQSSLRDEALEMLEAARHDAAPALRCRAKLMLPILMKAGITQRP
jgi:hypothetical protein